MKTQDNLDYDVTSSKSFSNSRFRFPFRQKPVISMNSQSTNSSTSGSAGTNAYNLFGFRKIGTPKNHPVSALPRKSVSFSGMDWKRKISSDHTDVAYREAVTRLRSILSPRPHGLLESSSSMKGSQGDVSKSFDSGPVSPPTSRRDRFNIRSIFSSKESPTKPQQHHQQLNNQLYSYIPSTVQQGCEDDLIDFINKQGEYIAQLEKETKYCRDDLANMLGKVREVISENEALHERQKRDILNNMIDQLDEKTDGYDSIGEKYSGGKKSTIKKSSSSNLILESKIAEMEAQLSQSKRSLQLAQEEILELRKNRLHNVDHDHSLVPSSVNPYAHCDLHRGEIENLNREKQNLVETLSKFKTMMSELRDRESEAARKVKNSLDIVETMQHEKSQSDNETRRLKDELERREQRLRELVSENCKKIHEEKMQMEMKYRQEIEMLNSNINVEMDALTRARLELERMKRNEIEIRRELQVKTQTMEDLRQENIIRMGHMQSELSQALLMKSQAEQDLINSRLLIEKVERDGKQETAKLQAEITGLRQRMEASDNDLLEAQELIVKLNETTAHFQRENTVLKSRDGGEEQDVFHVIHNMEDKHSKEMTELEQLIQAQNGLVEKLSTECKGLTDKLDDTSKQYRQDLLVELQSCVSNLPGYKKETVPENENEKDNDNEKTKPAIDQEKIKGLLVELNVIVQEMSQWVENHPVSGATGDEEDSDEEEEDDEDEEESEEEDDEEEDADGEGKEKAEGETEKSETENDEKKTKDGGKKKEKVKKSEKNEDGDDDEEEDEDEEDKDKDTDKDKDKTEEESKEKEKSPEKKEISEDANADTDAEKTPEKDVEEGEKTEQVEEKSEKVKEEPSSAEKEEKPESAKKEATKEITEKSEIAMIKVQEVNNQIEEWTKKIQDIVKRFSNSFPSKVAS